MSVPCLITNKPNHGRMVLTAVFLLRTEHAHETLANLAFRELNIVLGVTVILHKGKETIVGDVELNADQLVHKTP